MLFALAGILVAGCSLNTVHISQAELSKGYDSSSHRAIDPTATFSSADSTIHCVVRVVNAPGDTTVRAVWTAENVTDHVGVTYKDYKLVETTLAAKYIADVDDFTIHERNSAGWPVGQYKVDIYLDDKLDRTLQFHVS